MAGHTCYQRTSFSGQIPHLTHTSMTAARRAITYLHRLMASTCEADLAGSCSRALPKQIQQGHFSPRWRALLRTTLESLPPGPSPLEMAHGLKQSSIRTFLSAQHCGSSPPLNTYRPPAPTAHAKLSRLSSDAPSPLPTEGDAIGEYFSIACILSRETPLPAPTRRSRNWDEYFLVEWKPEKYPYHVVLAQRDHGLTTVSLIVLDEFTELAPIEEAELDPPCISCSKGGGDSMDPDLFQCERCLQWIHSYCLPTPVPTSEILQIPGWTCPKLCPPLQRQPMSPSTMLSTVRPSRTEGPPHRHDPWGHKGPQNLQT